MTTLTRRGWRGDKRTEPEEDAAADREQPDDDSDNSKATRLTLMEEVLLLGLAVLVQAVGGCSSCAGLALLTASLTWAQQLVGLHVS